MRVLLAFILGLILVLASPPGAAIAPAVGA